MVEPLATPQAPHASLIIFCWFVCCCCGVGRSGGSVWASSSAASLGVWVALCAVADSDEIGSTTSRLIFTSPM